MSKAKFRADEIAVFKKLMKEPWVIAGIASGLFLIFFAVMRPKTSVTVQLPPESE